MKSFHGNDTIASTSYTYNLCKSVSLNYLVVTVACIPSFECAMERRERRVSRKGSLFFMPCPDHHLYTENEGLRGLGLVKPLWKMTKKVKNL
jgi:hypothetical protein